MSTEAASPPPTDQALEAAAAAAPQADGDAMAELVAANQQLSFAQKPMVQNVLPFVTSVAGMFGSGDGLIGAPGLRANLALPSGSERVSFQLIGDLTPGDLR